MSDEIKFDPAVQRGTVYAVCGDPPRGVFATATDLAEAAAIAYRIDGYVVALPVVADMRVPTWTENRDRKAYEQWREAGDDW